MKETISNAKLDEILPEDVEESVREAAEISMGSEISSIDIINIHYLCDQVIEICEYRAQLYEYLKNRMLAIAPNLTVLVGELIGARLIAHAGSLLNLAKHPSSTVQILGAEKALFRALKTKHDTPKYGLIYHASLVGQAAPKHKGKISRTLAAKTSLAARVDALGEETCATIAIRDKPMVEKRIRECEQLKLRRISGTGKVKGMKTDKVESTGSSGVKYEEGSDFVFPVKRKMEEEEEKPTKKKIKREKQEE
jgi:nucleolar protein 58